MDLTFVDAALQSILDVELPGARLVSSSALAGGNFTSVRRVEVQLPRADALSLVARVQPRVAVDRLSRVLPLLHQVGVPAPELIGTEALDEGTALVLLGFLPGESVGRDLSLDARVRELASVLMSVHEVDPVPLGLEPFPLLPTEHLRNWISPHPRSRGTLDMLSRAASNLSEEPNVLTHGDYWTGNILWQDRTIVGVLDWDNLARAPRATDVAKCRLDLALRFGVEAADAFLGAYQEMTKADVPDVAYWDLRIGIEGMPDPGRWWLPTYRLLGVSDLSPAIVRQNYDQYLRHILDRLQG